MDPFTIGLIVAAGVALIAGATGTAGSVIQSQEDYEDLTDSIDAIDTLYADKEKELEDTYKKNKEDAEKSAANMQKQADLVDLQQDITENAVSTDFNTAIDNIYLSQQSDALSWNNAAMQIGSNKGAALASVAGSGVRAGSSLSDAIEMEAATNSEQLQFSQDAKRSQDNNNLASVLNNLAGNRADIMTNRIGADYTRQNATDLVNSWAEGGANYNLYQDNLKTLHDERDYKKKQLEKQRDRIWDNDKQWWQQGSVWDAILTFHTVGAKGYQTGYNISQTWS